MPVVVIQKLFFPVVWLFGGLSKLISFAEDRLIREKRPLVTEEELRTLLDVGKDEGTLEAVETQMLVRLFDFSGIRVRDIMRHRSFVKYVPVDAAYSDVIQLFNSGYSRLPVWKGSPETIVGVLHYKSVLFAHKEITESRDFVKICMKKAVVLPETLTALDALKRFKEEKDNFAIVLDEYGSNAGIVTMDDIFEVIEEETTEDIERMAGVVDDTTTEYLDTSVMQHVKSRLPWLFFLMLSYILTGAILTHFENGLQAVICLVTYMPMLMGTGGNSGSQSATLIIRGIGVGDLDIQDAGRVLWKEFRVSFTIGACLSAFTFVRVMIEQRGDPQQVMIALTVCIAMLAIVVIAKCIGGMLPMIARKIGIDPALMASPMIASLTDMVSVTTYFMLASIILGI